MDAKQIKIGWACRDITPDQKVALQGQFYTRITDEIRDPLTTTALALESEDGSEQAIIVSLDSGTSNDALLAGCRERLATLCPDFSPEKLFISATHTHTAPTLPHAWPGPGEDDDVMTITQWLDFLIGKVTEAADEAWHSRAPGAVSWGKADAVIGFNRRVSYFDGSSKMYGNSNDDSFSHIEGSEDHNIDMLFTYDPNHNLTGMLLNVPCPSQCSEMENYVSADYWHETRERLHARYGEEIFVLAQCGAAGDQSPRRMIKRDADMRMLRLKGCGDGYNNALRTDIARRISAAVEETLPLASKDIRDTVELYHVVEDVELTRRKATPEDVKLAEENVTMFQNKLNAAKGEDPNSRQYSHAFRSVNFHQATIDLYKAQQEGRQWTLPVELHFLRIGDIAMCSNRFEYFVDFAQRIKARAKALQTFVVQLAGEGTYLPTERGLKGGSYGAFLPSTPVGPEGGQEIVEKSVEMINGFWRD